MEIPDVPKPLLEALTQAAAGERCALVGGVVRDLLLHRHHEDPWRGLPDLDVVVEGRAADLVQRLPKALERRFGCSIPLSLQEHGAFGTFELELELPAEFGGTWLLDVASARQETYPEPGENPTVRLGSLKDDLARRDFTVNAMALELASGELLDLHHGQADLAARQLNLLHPSSLRDDPTRLVRGARYAARLGFHFSEDTHQQSVKTIQQWPWRWQLGDDPRQAPAALGTRLRKELDLLLNHEPWLNALEVLQAVGGMFLLDATLDKDKDWRRRLRWARRLNVPLFSALIIGSSDPCSLSVRMDLPHRHQRYFQIMGNLEQRIHKYADLQDLSSPSQWCRLLESLGNHPEVIKLLIIKKLPCWRHMLRWLLIWRHVRPMISTEELINHHGIKPGPMLGKALQDSRYQNIDNLFSLKAIKLDTSSNLNKGIDFSND